MITPEQAEQLALRKSIRESAPPLRTPKPRLPPCSRCGPRTAPLLTGNLTTVGADPNTSIAAGALRLPVFSRAAMGVGISQLITDFGRTSSLSGGPPRAAAQDRNTATTRAAGSAPVDQAYYNVLGADAVLPGWRRPRVQMQKLTLRQVQALAASSLKSSL